MNSSNPVEDQYSHYAYPEPGNDISVWQQSYNYNQYDPGLYSTLYWPEGRPRRDLNVLVAGCGTMQAAVLAFNNPECQFTGIDFSHTSIAHEAMLRDRHNLKNLTLRKMDLCDAATLGSSFDLIISSGVLHHLRDPSAGLRALASVLEPLHGAMLLMLYGSFGRSGVYALQDAFRRMRIPQSPEGVAMVRRTIQRLPPRHPARWYFDNSFEMKFDAAIVDTFLHPQDTAYSVQEVMHLIESNGLNFQGWLDSSVYNQNWEDIGKEIADRDRWSIIEHLSGTITTHSFIVSSLNRDKKSKIEFEGDRWISLYPDRHPDLTPSKLDASKCVRGKYEFSASPSEMILIAKANGLRTVGDILKDKSLAKMPRSESFALAREFYKQMWRLGHMFFSTVPIKHKHSDGS